jgi:dipeptidyl aminopeptidase/acylaminoacyl peptidase
MTAIVAVIAGWLAQTPAAPPPDTEIYLAPLTIVAGALTAGKPVNITNSAGYDNQPSFSPDGSAVFFTSDRGTPASVQTLFRTDIYRYDIKSRKVSRVTDTPEGEFSPTVTPDGRHISVIRVEADSTQRLWRFTLDGKQPELVLSEVKPVGYHAWADDHTLVLFVLGQPATLQIADTRTGTAEIVVRGVGRSIQRVPGGRTISFVEGEPGVGPGSAPTLWIRELDPKTKRITPLVRAVAGATEADCAWTPRGMLLMAHSGALYSWRRGDPGWTRVADLDALGLKGVTRLAVSPKGDWIALVAQK